MALSQLCDILVLQGEPLRCRDVLLELLQTVKQLGDVNTIIGTLCSLAYSTFIVGDWVEACRCYEEAIAIARQAPALFLEVPATGLAQALPFSCPDSHNRQPASLRQFQIL